MNDFKTIKQLADDLGVSKQTVQYHYKFLPTKGSKRNDKGIIVLNSFGIEWIKNRISKVDSKIVDKKTAKETHDGSTDNSFFLEQLKQKDTQIMKLIEGQEKLQKLLDQQQILTLQANKKIEELEMKSDDKETEQEEKNVESNRESEKKSSDSFWKKLFRKEK